VIPENQSKTVAEEAQAAADSLEDVLRRAQQMEPAAVPEMQEMLQSPKFLEAMGNLAERVEFHMVAAVSGGSLVTQEGMTRKLAEMRAELEGPDPTPLERQLVGRVVLSWLAVHEAEFQAVTAPDRGDYWQRRIDRAHRRHLSAVKALAAIRKLGVPAVRVNIANRQVNVAGAGPDAVAAAGPARATKAPGS
jgi:hypothetical protein